MSQKRRCRKQRAKKAQTPRYHIVSVRVTDEERQWLEQLSMESRKNVSELLRQALHLLSPARSAA